MQEVFSFLGNCKDRLASSLFINGLKKDAPTPRRQLVDDIFNLFITGYNAALETDPDNLAKYLSGVEFIERSVMLEGSYAAVASMDLNGENGNSWLKLQALMAVASDNVVSINEGIGHALCQQRVRVDFDPAVTSSFWGWMAIDGYGCHAGYFRWPSVINRLEIPAGLDELGMHAFDQGLGRAIWLIGAAHPKTIAQTVNRFPHHRRADLWSGVGMMSGFWGAADSTDMSRLLSASGRWRSWLQSGVAFSAKGRMQTGDAPAFTKEACSVICKSNVIEMTDLADSCLANVQELEGSAQFSHWKLLLAQQFQN